MENLEFLEKQSKYYIERYNKKIELLQNIQKIIENKKPVIDNKFIPMNCEKDLNYYDEGICHKKNYNFEKIISMFPVTKENFQGQLVDDEVYLYLKYKDYLIRVEWDIKKEIIYVNGIEREIPESVKEELRYIL